MRIALFVGLCLLFGILSGVQPVTNQQGSGQPATPVTRLSAVYLSDVIGKDVEVQEHPVDRFARAADRADPGVPLITRDAISEVITDRAMNITRSGRGSGRARGPSIVVRTTDYSIQNGTNTTAFLRFETTDEFFSAFLTGRREEGSAAPTIRRRASVAVHAYVKKEKVYSDICGWRDFKLGRNRSSMATVFTGGDFAAYRTGRDPLKVAFPIRAIGDAGLEAMMKSDRLELIFYDPDDSGFKYEVSFQNYHDALNTAIAWSLVDYSGEAFKIETDFTVDPIVKP